MMRVTSLPFALAVVLTGCGRASSSPDPLAKTPAAAVVSSTLGAAANAPASMPVSSDPSLFTAVAFVSPGCVRRADENVWCWGEQDWDTAGAETLNPPIGLRPVPALTGARQIVNTRLLNYILMNDGTVRAWGRVTDDVNRTLIEFKEPTVVPGLADIEEIVGRSFLCARQKSGAVLCWQDRYVEGEEEELPDTLERMPPAPMGKLGRALQISAGDDRVCAVLDGGSVACWGEVSIGTPGEPKHLPKLGGVAQVATGILLNICARLHDGTVSCTRIKRDDSFSTTMGNDRVWLAQRRGLEQVEGLSKVEGLVMVHETPYARVTGGRVFWWGDSRDGAGDERARSPTTVLTTPVEVPGLTGVVALQPGLRSCCALLSDSTVRCWGDNKKGQLGDGTTNPSNVPIPVRLPGGAR